MAEVLFSLLNSLLCIVDGFAPTTLVGVLYLVALLKSAPPFLVLLYYYNTFSFLNSLDSSLVTL